MPAGAMRLSPKVRTLAPAHLAPEKGLRENLGIVWNAKFRVRKSLCFQRREKRSAKFFQIHISAFRAISMACKAKNLENVFVLSVA